MASRSLYEHATANESLARFHAQAQRLLRIQHLLESALPPRLRKHARVANLRAGKLVLLAANASVATKIRQLAESLAAFFASEGIQFNEIDVRVQPSTPVAAAPHGDFARHKPLPSADRVRQLAAIADGMREDNPLRDALRSLADSLARAPRR